MSHYSFFFFFKADSLLQKDFEEMALQKKKKKSSLMNSLHIVFLMYAITEMTISLRGPTLPGVSSVIYKLQRNSPPRGAS